MYCEPLQSSGPPPPSGDCDGWRVDAEGNGMGYVCGRQTALPCPLYNGHGDVGVTQYIRRSSVVFHRVCLKQVYRRVLMQSQWITLCLCLLAYVLRNLYFHKVHSLYVQLLSHS